MSVASTRLISITFTGDVSETVPANAASNAASPGVVELKTLAIGDNTITVPTGGATVTGATIMMPAGNTQLVKLKGVGGDTGVALHKTDPTSIGLDSSVATFILNAAAQVTGVRIVWS